jgi:predicted nucleic acid-binding protein
VILLDTNIVSKLIRRAPALIHAACGGSQLSSSLGLDRAAAGSARSLLRSGPHTACDPFGDEAIAAICRGRRRGRRSLSPKTMRPFSRIPGLAGRVFT